MKIAIENQALTHEAAITGEIRSGSAPDVTDFFELRHQLILENREIDSIRSLRWVKLADTAERSLYWLIPAATLTYLVFRILPLLGS